MFELASLVAFNEWVKLTKPFQERGQNTAVTTFKESPKSPREGGCYKVRVETQEGHLNDIPGIVEKIGEDSRFALDKSRGFYQIDFKYCPTAEDYKYLMAHRDQYWLSRKKQLIEFLLPLVAGFAATLGLLYKISYLLSPS